jgi:hypothetical protein
MEVVLLNVMGSAAVASAVIVGFMATRLSRELAGAARRITSGGTPVSRISSERH